MHTACYYSACVGFPRVYVCAYVGIRFVLEKVSVCSVQGRKGSVCNYASNIGKKKEMTEFYQNFKGIFNRSSICQAEVQTVVIRI